MGPEYLKVIYLQEIFVYSIQWYFIQIKSKSLQYYLLKNTVKLNNNKIQQHPTQRFSLFCLFTAAPCRIK